MNKEVRQRGSVLRQEYQKMLSAGILLLAISN